MTGISLKEFIIQKLRRACLYDRTKKIKTLSIAALFFCGAFFIFITSVNRPVASADTGSSDAIAIRVMPNPDHFSPLRWYSKNVNVQGAPQSLSVDGYQAVRDGRTVYVNAANIVDNGGDGIYENYFTNIYIISYNQDADQATMDILGQILDHWKFNVNLMNDNGAANKCENIGEEKSCSGETCLDGYVCEGNKCVIKCLFDKDCPAGGYCLSKKARLVRDTIRLSDLAEMKIALKDYHERGYYPKLESGTYLKGRTISVWPSWQENFAGELGLKPLMSDPVNKIGACSDARFKAETCWDEEKKEFDDPTPNNGVFNMQAGSKVYYYELKKDDGSEYLLCANLESDKADFIPSALSGENCVGD
ncbi:MAG: hypothetical protein WCW25_03025 [Patescibacteria group bacterium]|jgi:hypothetical protein